MTIEKAINTFVTNLKDVTVLGIENAFSKYVANVYDDLAFDDYISFISDKASVAMQEHELYLDYKKAFRDDVYSKSVALEKEKMLYFLLTHTQNIVLVKTGQKQEEKKFLGYEFSERRGHEGIKHLPNGTKLFDENGDLLNPQKANSYIYNAFLDKEVNIDKSLARNVSYGHMSGFINYGTSKFDRTVNLNKKKKIISNWQLKTFGNLLSDKTLKQDSGFAFPKHFQGNKNTTDIPFYKVSDMNHTTNMIKMVHSENYIDGDTLRNEIKGRTFPKGAIIFPKVGMALHTNKKRMLSEEAVCDNNIMAIWSENEDVLLNKYLFYFMCNCVILSDYASNTNPPAMNINRLSEIKIPIPSLEVQQKIVAEIEGLELQESEAKKQKEALKVSISSIIKDSFITADKVKRLGSLASYSTEKVSCVNLSADSYIGVDNMLQNMEGKIASQFTPSSGTATAYSVGDILLSNIRPYLRKIWLADNGGGASGDVLVLKVNKEVICSKYLFHQLATDEFFDYEMQHVKGVKMPRADKTRILNYPIYVAPVSEQKEVLAKLEQIESEIIAQDARLEELKAQKDEVLKKYL